MTALAARWRERVEFERRLVHAGGVFYPVPYLLGWISWETTGYVLAAGVVAVGLLEFLRLVVGIDHAIYRALTRPYESDGVAGYALYQVSMAAVALVFVPAIAIPAMWMLAIGDPISGMLGTNAATEPKRPAVWVAMFGVCFALAAPFTVAAFGTAVGAAVAAVGAIGATVADGLPPIIRGVAVDDNLTIPPTAALGMITVLTLLS